MFFWQLCIHCQTLIYSLSGSLSFSARGRWLRVLVMAPAVTSFCLFPGLFSLCRLPSPVSVCGSSSFWHLVTQSDLKSFPDCSAGSCGLAVPCTADLQWQLLWTVNQIFFFFFRSELPGSSSTPLNLDELTHKAVPRVGVCSNMLLFWENPQVTQLWMYTKRCCCSMKKSWIITNDLVFFKKQKSCTALCTFVKVENNDFSSFNPCGDLILNDQTTSFLSLGLLWISYLRLPAGLLNTSVVMVTARLAMYSWWS